MEYAQKILSRFGQMGDGRIRRKYFVESITCAFCSGTGIDPKYGNASRCPVCGATGHVKVTPPVITCLKCSGSGREGGDLNCLACKGVGMVSVRKEADMCPRCNGKGEEGIFYCSACKGQGIL